MTTHPEMRPRGPDGYLRLLIDHNPFYLLSAVLMLLGVFMVNSAENMHPGDLTKLLCLLAVLNVYELLVIGLGRVLVWKPTVPRDGVTLLILEALFFVDGTFLNAEAVMTRIGIGTFINLGLLVLAVGKTAFILKTMRIRLTTPLLAFLSLQLAALFLLPVVLKLEAGSDRSVDLTLYAAWWVAGLMPVAYEVLSRAFAGRMGAKAAGKSAALRLVYVILPFVSLVAHIGFMHWVYKADFYAAELAPIFLGLAVSLMRIDDKRATLIWRLALPAGALIVCLQNPAALQVEFLRGFPTLTPLRAAMVGAYLTLSYVCFMQYMLYFLAGGIIMLGAAVFGPSVATTVSVADGCLATVRRMIPKTPVGWGIVCIAGSFALLAIGAVVSWISHLRGRTNPPTAQVPPT